MTSENCTSEWPPLWQLLLSALFWGAHHCKVHWDGCLFKIDCKGKSMWPTSGTGVWFRFWNQFVEAGESGWKSESLKRLRQSRKGKCIEKIYRLPRTIQGHVYVTALSLRSLAGPCGQCIENLLYNARKLLSLVAKFAMALVIIVKFLDLVTVNVSTLTFITFIFFLIFIVFNFMLEWLPYLITNYL